MSTTNWGVLLGTILCKNKIRYIYMLENKKIYVISKNSIVKVLTPF
jgi:hypothetical protein